MRLVEIAPAKVNLFLHVGPLGADGYHPIASLMTFADFGDELGLEDELGPEEGEGAGPIAELLIGGEFRGGLDAAGDNLVLAARDALLAASGRTKDKFRLSLTKSLPVASGLGGGSADAAAALRLIARRFGIELPKAQWDRLQLALGSDVPACFVSQPVFVQGRGEALRLASGLPVLDAVLVNPAVAVSTARVFARFDDGMAAGAPVIGPVDSLTTSRALIDWLGARRNDLQDAASAEAPVIGEVLATLEAAPQCRLARMSGSGATCFALCEDQADAQQLALDLAAAHPKWWVKACRLGG